jgi:uncharacterized membrane protein YeaQ/YmgE (transglycosylase-associated protein family)
MESSDYFSNSAKFIFVAVNIKNLRPIFYWFLKLGVLNAICVRKFNGELEIFSYNKFTEDKSLLFDFYQINTTTNVDLLFPDKLKDLKGYTYRTPIVEERMYVMDKESIAHGNGIYFLQAVAKKQNAKVQVYPIENKFSDRKQSALDMFKGRYDFFINTNSFISDDPNGPKQAHIFKMVNTFETDAMCVLLPIPPPKSRFEFIHKPFDAWTWILIIATIIAGALAWKIVSGTSAGFYVFSFLAGMVGHCLRFQRHLNRKARILLQITILMTFVLSTAYQSLMVSFILDSRDGEKIKTIDEMLTKNFSFMVDPTFTHMIDSFEYGDQLRADQMKTIDSYNDVDYKSAAKQNVAIIGRCSQTIDYSEINENYYIMDQKFFTFYKQFPTAPYSVFHERLEEFSLRLSETGVKDRWNQFLPYENALAKIKREYMEREEYLMNLDDLYPAFCLLLGGLAVATLVLIFELFLYSFICKMLARMIEWRCCWFMRQAGQLRVRFVQVQPMEIASADAIEEIEESDEVVEIF